MEDYRAAARLVRFTARNLIHNLTFIPAERLHWKPDPGAKSAMEAAGEAAQAMQMMLPVFEGRDWQPAENPVPKSVEEAKALLFETADRYAAALESAGPALERPVTVAGVEVWATNVVLFPVVDLIHHHGQIAYIQMLLGDMESHFDMEATARWFGRNA